MSTKREFDGMGGWTEDQMGSSIFFTLCAYIDLIYRYLYKYSKIFINIVMGLKFWCQVGEFGFHFHNSYGEMCFWKITLKVRCFRSTNNHRPFCQNLMSSWGVGVWFTRATTGLFELVRWPLASLERTVTAEVSTKPLQLPPTSAQDSHDEREARV